MLSAMPGVLNSEQVAAAVGLTMGAAWWDLPYGEASGANLIWELQVEVARGLATDNTTAVSEAFTRAWEEVRVVNFTSQGLQTDSAYHFHGPQILSGVSVRSGRAQRRW